MFEHISNLKNEEKEIILNSPMYVSLLIAGADGDINVAEKQRIIELIHTKTFSEKYELRELYKSLDHDSETELRKLIASLPEERLARTEILTELLSRLNHIMPKLEHRFQVELYKSLRQFAYYIAKADGGFWGLGGVTLAEENLLQLPMIHNPEADSAE